MSEDLGLIAPVANGEDRQGRLAVSRFHGGVDRGPMIQLTLPFGWDLVQLTRNQARVLIFLLRQYLRHGDPPGS